MGGLFACLCCVYFFSPIGLRPLAICILCITYCIFFQGRSLGLMIDACLPASKKLENVEKVCHEHVEREPLLPGAPKMDGGLEEWGLLLAL